MLNYNYLKGKVLIGGAIALAIVFSGQLGNGDFFGIKAAFGYGGGGGGTYVAPEITAINTPLTVGSSQEGSLTENVGGDTVKIEVPKGAVSGQTTFNIEGTTATAGEAPANTTGAFMIGNKVFNINATDANNNAVRDFNSNLHITLTLSDLPPDTSDLGVYWFNDTTGMWTLVVGAIFDPANGTVSFNVNHLTKFAILRILGTPYALAAAQTDAVVSPVVVEQKKIVLKKFKDGSLLRTGDKVYILMKGKRVRIRNMKDLAKYKGQKYNQVDQATLYQYPEVAYVAYPNNTIIKSDNKIYIIKNGKAQRIKNVKEFSKFIKQYNIKKIFNVPKDALDLY